MEALIAASASAFLTGTLGTNSNRPGISITLAP